MKLATLMTSVALTALAGTAFATDDGIGQGPEIFPHGTDCSDLGGAARTDCMQQQLGPDDGDRGAEAPQAASTEAGAAAGAEGTSGEDDDSVGGELADFGGEVGEAAENTADEVGDAASNAADAVGDAFD